MSFPNLATLLGTLQPQASHPHPQEPEPEDEAGIAGPPLLPVPDTLAKPDDSLCDTCRALDLNPRRFVVGPSTDNEETNQPEEPEPDINLGLVQDIKNKPHCPFCRLILAALGPNTPTVEDGEQVAVTMSWDTDGPTPDINAPWNRIPKIRILRPYAQKEGGGWVSASLNLFPEITLLANDSPTPSKTFFSRVISDQIDFAMVQNWLSTCETLHGDQCNKTQMLDHEVEDPATEIPSFRLIDVVDNCIVPAPHNSKYVALSYVWGDIKPETVLRTLQGNVEELEKPGALSLSENYDRIPLTIRDAMQVVRELNLRYLWVDILCLIQDEAVGQSRLHAISKMDIVYAAAHLTILAGTGADANAGLPGVQPGTRKVVQPMEEILPGLRLAYRAKHYDYIKDSVYYTRGWTFQERQFAKRSLLFIGGQVVYMCTQTDQWREDVFYETQSANSGVATRNRDQDDIGQFEGLIQSYSGLALSYDTDIYHAFAGIIRYFKMELQVNLCHGIPDAYFDWFLLWTSLGPQIRREGTPSWSWSGWTGESWPNIWNWYSRSITKVREALKERTWIIWYHRKAHDSTECVQVWQHPPSSSSPSNFYGGQIRNRFPFDCSQTLPSPRTLANAPKYIDDTYNPTPGSGFLQFWTVSVLFNVAEPTSKNDQLGPNNTLSRLGIFGRDGRELGIVFVNPDWREKLVHESYEFILLCEGRDVRAEGGNMDEEEGWKYKVMLIEWHGDWAERISVGSIGKQDLDQALEPGPVWKEIILG
ncbi:hypothetical protein GALMADRAFT_570303 [Galerina marginata CBS 339.88]|uniref:Heterokaryon incompatibility domain-containing protein n=1 Tax=Galerina marginata (strain CBS 339.88) TaxID=685588 RepID=A0A067SY65_GALM3|nr:hypothetical protein GALMADRAFT_570303 [Galerina marginata CBS 339.88]